ncbi:MAG: hypothetical protein BMS9Abin31_1284 [Gammaproteobacteria bacterium]|nr:MAG: hypothetical protein BMS9Abin31_1284 [Gammaproteobacteria bacterium]
MTDPSFFASFVSSVTRDLSASEVVLNETRSGSTVLLELTYMSESGYLEFYSGCKRL